MAWSSLVGPEGELVPRARPADLFIEGGFPMWRSGFSESRWSSAVFTRAAGAYDGGERDVQLKWRFETRLPRRASDLHKVSRLRTETRQNVLDVHFWPTPNGKKITVFLEEAGLEHRIVPCNIGRGDQFQPSYLALNPNHRMPVLVDHDPAGGGAPIAVFESGAILLYLAEKSGKLWASDLRGRYEITQWVMWQMANQGPKSGELGHFLRLGDKQGDQSYALRRFGDEVNRLYGVMNNRLYDRRYLAGSEYTIADVISYPWVVSWKALQQDLEEFKYLKRWFDELSARPALQRGMAVGADFAEDFSKLSPEEIQRRTKLLYNQRALKAPESGGI
jgi:GSH-dependent disulfide-bond oxidoreductase